MNIEELLELLKKAKAGDVLAQNDLGVVYLIGKSGFKKDYQEAAKWFLKAAEKGLAKAQYNIGEMYHHGQGVPLDYQEAAKWFLKAAEQGDSLSQYNLGCMYLYGYGVPENNERAKYWFEKCGIKTEDMNRLEI